MARIQKKIQVESEKQVVRERLLQSALDLFDKKGFASTSVREIVEAADVTKPTLYYYFKNKEGIYLELMSKPFEVIEKILDESVRKRLAPVSEYHDCLTVCFSCLSKTLRLRVSCIRAITGLRRARLSLISRNAN